MFSFRSEAAHFSFLASAQIILLKPKHLLFMNIILMKFRKFWKNKLKIYKCKAGKEKKTIVKTEVESFQWSRFVTVWFTAR